MNLRVATWNLARPVASERDRNAALAHCLGEVGADIWILTESHVALSPGPAFTPIETIASDRVQDPGEVWTVIWSRFPMTRLPTGADPARSVAALVEPPDGGALVVYGTVLPWLGSPWGGYASKGGKAYVAAVRAQQAEWRTLQADHAKCTFILAGDFNQDLGEVHHYGSRAQRAALEQALYEAGLVCLTSGADDPVRAQTGGHWQSIDHICVSAGVASHAARPRRAWPAGTEPQRRLTDHFGVAVELPGA